VHDAIGFIGTGHIAAAVVEGLVTAPGPAPRICVSPRNAQKAAELAKRFDIHPTMISSWKRELLEGAADIFDKGKKGKPPTDVQVGELYRQIGQLKVENDFLARKLGS